MQSNQQSEVEAFYDNFQRRLVQDYILGNERILGAISFVQRHLYPDCRALLDIGCGLGWSSYEFARLLPEAQVVGIDLSGELLKTAGRLFSRPNLSYEKTDITAGRLPFSEPLDAITLIDVYEHIPWSERAAFHRQLNQALSDRGQLFLTCPSVLHQQWLRRHRPEGLQPVDEDVTLEAVQALAHSLAGEVIIFQHVSIWKTNDYFYALIEKAPRYTEDSRPGRAQVTPRLSRLWRTFRYLPWRQNPLREPSVGKYYLKTFFRNH